MWKHFEHFKTLFSYEMELLLVQVPQPTGGLRTPPAFLNGSWWSGVTYFDFTWHQKEEEGLFSGVTFFLPCLFSLALDPPGDEPNRLAQQRFLLPPRLGIGIIIWISAITDRSGRYECFITLGAAGDCCPDIWIHVAFSLQDWLWKKWICLHRLTSAGLRDRACLALVLTALGTVLSHACWHLVLSTAMPGSHF